MSEHIAVVTESTRIVSEHNYKFYKDWGTVKKDIVRMPLRYRPKFIKSVIEDIEYNNRYKEKRLNINQIQAFLVDTGLGSLRGRPYIQQLLDIEEHILHDTDAGNSKEVTENYEDSIMPFKYSNITISDTNYKLSMHEGVAGSLSNFSRKIRLHNTTVAIMCIIHGANKIIEDGYEGAYRKSNVTAIKKEIIHFDIWLKRQIVRLFVEYDDYEFDLTNGTIKFKYQFNYTQNFTFNGDFNKTEVRR